MVSQKGTLCFSSGNAKMGLSIGDQYIVPAIKELCTQTSDGSEQVVEKVREDWCKLLGPEDPLSEGMWFWVIQSWFRLVGWDGEGETYPLENLLSLVHFKIL